MKLTDWRGVRERDFAFAEGVTLIEGPNEIGKSTVVEALRTLFDEFDSTKKASVKAVQPVGRDVGSRVEVEIKTGDYHFVFVKTFNRQAQTTLDVLAPTKGQWTGREAHDEALRMLIETVDMDLWKALLVDQGEKVALANLQDSSGLARALDDAAGTSGSGDDDSRLVDAVQAEYESYFTPKSGKPRHDKLEQRVDDARRELDDCRQRVTAVEDDVAAHERCVAELQRLDGELPQLDAKVREHEEAWRAVRSLTDRRDAAHREFDLSQGNWQAANDALTERHRLDREIRAARDTANSATERLAPQEVQVRELQAALATARAEATRARDAVKEHRDALERARADAANLAQRESMARDERTLHQSAALVAELRDTLAERDTITIDDLAVDAFRQTEQALAIARSQRQSAATAVTITAERDLAIDVDGETIDIADGQVAARSIASDTTLHLPGVASIRIAPSQSAAELDATVEDAEGQLAALTERYNVSDLGAAVAANQRRIELDTHIASRRQRQKDLLDGRSIDELERTIATQRERTEALAKSRSADHALPETVSAAEQLAEEAARLSAAAEAKLDNARTALDTLQRKLDDASSALQVKKQEAAGYLAALQDKEARLAAMRERHTDAVLQKQLADASAAADKLAATVEALDAEVRDKAPDALEELLGNARAVYERARNDRDQQDRQLAVLTDRLQNARADGRFDDVEAAERSLAHLEEELASTVRRANAAERLWAVLSRHRDAAFERYVQPLKDAVERLGRIVYGADFEVDIGDDWSIVSRTLHQQTIPFDDLSVGTKEQLSILVRLAAAQIVSTQGGVPLIIDDALGFSDPSRLESMGAAIAAAGRSSQIVILTCTPGRFMHVGNAEVVAFQ